MWKLTPSIIRKNSGVQSGTLCDVGQSLRLWTPVKEIIMGNITVKVNHRYQIALPQVARQQLHIQSGDYLLMDIQDGMIILFPRPTDYVAYLAGLHREIWQGIEVTKYLEEERDAWETSVAN
jgi:AbrB family looped-hinge helix DNA binding protein